MTNRIHDNVIEIFEFIKAHGKPIDSNSWLYQDIIAGETPHNIVISTIEVDVSIDLKTNVQVFHKGKEDDLEIISNYIRLIEFTQGNDPGDIL